MKKLLLILFACIFIKCAFSQTTMNSKIISLINSTDSVTVKQKTKFTVEIQKQAGTGYSWVLAEPVKFCSFINSTMRKAAPGNSLGAAEIQSLGFKAVSTGTEDITFLLKRPFEKDKPAAEQKTLHVIVVK